MEQLLTDLGKLYGLHIGVITDIQNIDPPKFAPVYDTARALYWNFSDEKVQNVTQCPEMMRVQIEKYGKNSKLKMGIENRNNPNHFKFVREACDRFPNYV